MNALDQMLSRGQGGMSLFAGAEKTDDQVIAELSAYAQAAPAAAAPVEQEQPPEPVAPVEVPAASEPVPDASRDLGMALPTLDLDAAEASLAESIGKEAAKTFMETVARPLSSQVNAAAAQANQARVERMVNKFGAVYPEIKRPGALSAVVNVALAGAKPGESDEAAFQRALVTVYSDRKAEMRAQVSGQMTAPQRRVDSPKPMSEDDINIACIHEMQKNGVQAALALKQRLTSAR